MKDRETIENNLNMTTAHHDSKSGVIISHFKNNANGDSWQDIIVIYNATSINGYDINALMPIPTSKIWHHYRKSRKSWYRNHPNNKLWRTSRFEILFI